MQFTLMRNLSLLIRNDQIKLMLDMKLAHTQSSIQGVRLKIGLCPNV